jgi:glutamyl-tRNA synthetase
LISSPPPCDVGPKLARIVEATGDRLKVAGDILLYADFFFTDRVTYDPQAVEKNLRKPGALALLAKFNDQLAAVEPFEVEPLEKALQQFVADERIKVGDIIHALRVAVTGKAVGPGLYDCLALLGKEISLRRIDRALAEFSA